MLSGEGAREARLVDLSQGGAAISGVPTLRVSSSGALEVPGLGQPVRFTVRSLDPQGVAHVQFQLDTATTGAVGAFVARLAQRQAA
jgi:hypothetical protein